MLIYAVADIHAKPERLEQIQSNIAVYHPDVLIIAGDIFNYLNPKPVLESLNRINVPVLAVRGNSDPAYLAGYFNSYSKVRLMHARRVMLNGKAFAGVSGTIPVPFRSRVGLLERYLMQKIRPMIDAETIFIAHPPPYGTLDRVGGRFHAGSAMVRDLVVQKRPRILVCGHIHEDTGTAMLNETMVVNCCMSRGGQGALIEINDNRSLKVEMM
jgi:uncharacterized protein